MLFLLMVPVIAVVAGAHHILQLYAPSNVVVARVRAERPHFRTALRLLGAAAALVTVAHIVSDWVALGGPGWLNLVVLLLLWDSIKFGVCAAAGLVRMAVGCLVRYPPFGPAARRIESRCHPVVGDPAWTKFRLPD